MYRLHAAPDFASTIPHLALVQLGVPFDLVIEDFDAGSLGTPAYRAINPLGLIPSMENPTLRFAPSGVLLPPPSTSSWTSRTTYPAGLPQAPKIRR